MDQVRREDREGGLPEVVEDAEVLLTGHPGFLLNWGRYWDSHLWQWIYQRWCV